MFRWPYVVKSHAAANTHLSRTAKRVRLVFYAVAATVCSVVYITICQHDCVCAGECGRNGWIPWLRTHVRMGCETCRRGYKKLIINSTSTQFKFRTGFRQRRAISDVVGSATSHADVHCISLAGFNSSTHSSATTARYSVLS